MPDLLSVHFNYIILCSFSHGLIMDLFTWSLTLRNNMVKVLGLGLYLRHAPSSDLHELLEDSTNSKYPEVREDLCIIFLLVI
jgi:hypothetical protein